MKRAMDRGQGDFQKKNPDFARSPTHMLQSAAVAPPGYPPFLVVAPGPPKPWVRKAAIGAALHFLIPIALVLLILGALWLVAPGGTRSGPASIGLAAGQWNGGLIQINFTSLNNVSRVGPSLMTYEIQDHGIFLFKGSEGPYSWEPNTTITVTFHDGDALHSNLSLQDFLTVEVAPPTSRWIHPVSFSVRYDGRSIGETALP